MHPQALNYLVAALASASVMLVAFVLNHVFLWFRVRKLTEFWRPFLSDEVSIVITEYAVSGGTPEIKDEWIQRAIDHPEQEHVQADGRIRRWARIEEMEGRYLRVVLLPDGETVHNAFFDRGFKL